jgi:WD40 repeat protein/transcriptional regulator with XRE-family HTH domain
LAVELEEVVVTVETSFGRWLQRRRKALDLTQEELAQRVGCAAETLRKIEADVRRPSRQIAERLAEALEIPEEDRAAFVKAARAELAVDRLKSPTQDLSQVAFVPAKVLSSEAVSFQFTQISSTIQTKPFDGRCPYKGLDVFEEEDAELFFGREKLVEDLVRRLEGSRTLFIIGPSGSGKSSLVRAGLLHALKQGGVENLNSERWLYETMIPGRDPIGELARVISSMAGTTKAGEEVRANALEDESIFAQWCEIALKEGRDRRAVLFVDQFEEVFTQVSSEAERLTFLNLLTHAATAEGGRVIVLFAMRSDFVLNCATYPKLNALFNRQSIQIGAMQPEELVSAIAQPALRVGLRIDPDLVAQIVNDMQGEPGTLPLMQFALKDLFDAQQAKGGMIALTLNDYLQHGGIHKSLERHADGSFAKLNEGEQQLARSIFSGLIEIGRGTQDTRRTALFEELVPVDKNAEAVEAIIQKLADARLITTDEQAGRDTVTISHEKLIDAWPWLKRLVDETRDAIALQNEIANDAKDWNNHRRDASYLYGGGRLANLREKLAAGNLVLTGSTHEFVQASYARRRRDNVARIASISAILGLIIAGILLFTYVSTENSKSRAEQSALAANTQQAIAGIAQANADEAQKQAQIARVGELSALASLKGGQDYDQALLFGIEALKLAEQIDQNKERASDAMRGLLQSNTGLKRILRDINEEITSVAFSADAKILAVGTIGDLFLWDVSNLDSPRQLPSINGYNAEGFSSSISNVAFNPVTPMMAFRDADGNIFFWDVSEPDRISQTGQLLSHSDFSDSDIAFNADGKMLASVSDTGSILVWDVTDPGSPKQLNTIPQGLPGQTSSLVWHPAQDILAVGGCAKDDNNSCPEGGTSLWNLEDPVHPILLVNFSQQPSITSSLAFTSDGTILAIGSDDATVSLWNTVTLSNPIRISTLSGHTSSVHSIALSSDAKTLASASIREVLVWDISTPSVPVIINTFRGHTAAVSAIDLIPDGKTLASGGADNKLILWDTPTSTSHMQVSNIIGVFLSAMSPDGNLLATVDLSSTLTLWNISDPKALIQLGSTHIQDITILMDMFFAPDGTLLVLVECTGQNDNFECTESKISIREATPALAELVTKKMPVAISALAMSPTGKTFALASCNRFDCGEGQIELFAFSRSKFDRITTINVSSFYPRELIFSPNEKELVINNGQEILFWDITSVTNPKQLSSLSRDTFIYDMAIDSDGKKLVLGEHQQISTWDISDPIHPEHLSTRPGFSGYVTNLAFDKNGKILASANEKDKTIMLWDLSDPRRLVPMYSLGRLEHNVSRMEIRPDGKTLISTFIEGYGLMIIWDLDPVSWIQKACQIAGRNFTREEWTQYFPDEAYRTTCPQWPAGY